MSLRVALKATHRLIRMFSFGAIAAAVLATAGGVLAFAFDFVGLAVDPYRARAPSTDFSNTPLPLPSSPSRSLRMT